MAKSQTAPLFSLVRDLQTFILTKVYYLSPKKLDAWIEIAQGKSFTVTDKTRKCACPVEGWLIVLSLYTKDSILNTEQIGMIQIKILILPIE